MADRETTPREISEIALDDVSGGPTEELFGAYHFTASSGKMRIGGPEVKSMERVFDDE